MRQVEKADTTLFACEAHRGVIFYRGVKKEEVYLIMDVGLTVAVLGSCVSNHLDAGKAAARRSHIGDLATIKACGDTKRPIAVGIEA